MVDRADTVLGIWDGKHSGGTFSCLKYAAKEQKNIVVMNSITGVVEFDNDRNVHNILG